MIKIQVFNVSEDGSVDHCVKILISNFLVSAERRAQLARSRSRQNIFQGQSPDIVREINFDESHADTPTRPARNKKSQRRARMAAASGVGGDTTLDTTNTERSFANGDINSNSKSANQGSGLSEAEQLLERLKAL